MARKTAQEAEWIKGVTLGKQWPKSTKICRGPVMLGLCEKCHGSLLGASEPRAKGCHKTNPFVLRSLLQSHIGCLSCKVNDNIEMFTGTYWNQEELVGGNILNKCIYIIIHPFVCSCRFAWREAASVSILPWKKCTCKPHVPSSQLARFSRATSGPIDLAFWCQYRTRQKLIRSWYLKGEGNHGKS